MPRPRKPADPAAVQAAAETRARVAMALLKAQLTRADVYREIVSTSGDWAVSPSLVGHVCRGEDGNPASRRASGHHATARGARAALIRRTVAKLTGTSVTDLFGPEPT